MGAALYNFSPNAKPSHCPHAPDTAVAWSDDLPTPLKHLVVAPVSFHVHRDYEMLAKHIDGCDAANRPCFCEFHFVMTQLRSDDDEVFFETPIYSETLTSWRLIDERWLVCRTTVDRLAADGSHTQLSISNAMPR
ncbi:hypothetical protein [Rhodoferax sp.]|uniref:hypothetical protein n=1 Tax=Rhodoferax sp. TaxID=50421 RepID=UPI002841B6F4|nr:hypothetical protein [Rhodoferax sp.]MDR3369524.1 hypothetical protein [Rhodoferax sp.]